MGTYYCFGCGADIDETAQTCPKCGRDLSAPVNEQTASGQAPPRLWKEPAAPQPVFTPPPAPAPKPAPVMTEAEIAVKPTLAEKIIGGIFCAAALISSGFMVHYFKDDLWSYKKTPAVIDIVFLLVSLSSAAVWIRRFFPKKLHLRLAADESMLTDPEGEPYIAEQGGVKNKIPLFILGCLIAAVGFTFAILFALYVILCFDKIDTEERILFSVLFFNSVSFGIIGLRLRKPKKRRIPVDISRSGNGYSITQRHSASV